MKKNIVILLLVLTGTAMGAVAQTWNEFFKQKKTQKKYLLEQIAALNVYTAYLQKGYEIAASEMGLVGKLTGEESLLHKDFFVGLKEINPLVKSSANALELLAYQAAILQNMNVAIHAANLNSSDKDHISGVRSRLLRECDQDLEEFLELITASAIELSDDERIARIENVHRSLEDKFHFSKSFAGDVRLLSIQRQRERNEIESTTKFYGLVKSPNP